MKTRLLSTFAIRHSLFTPIATALLAAFTLLTTAARAPAQTGWGNALSFDGVNDAVSVSGITLTNTSMTIELWARRARTGWWDPFVSQGWGALSNGLFFSFNSGDVVVFGYYGSELYTPQTYTDTSWHHWAATHNQVTGERCIYRDGQIVATDTNWGSYTGSGELWIAKIPFGAPDYFQGQLDEIRIWRVARSAGEIRQYLSHRLTGRESNLIAYWKFDEGSGTTAHDSTTNGHNGTLNGPLWIPSAIPWLNALSFDGVDDYMVVTNFGSAMPTNEVTVEFWQRLAVTNRIHRVFGLVTDDPANRFMFEDRDDGSFLWDFGNISSSGRLWSGKNLAVTNSWQHIALVAQVGTTNYMAIYCNGVLKTNKSSADAFAPYSSHLFMGYRPDVRLYGQLEDFRIWNRARSQAEIQEDMCHPLTGTESNLVAYYRFDEGSGTTPFDATDNHLDGTLVNGPVWTNSTIPPFINLNAGLPGILGGSVAWGDYDNDGRLDFLLTGSTNFSTNAGIAQLWKNTGSGFTNVTTTVTPGLPRVYDGSIAWGDFDNDGRLDFLLTGNNGTNPVAQVWKNTGSGFTNLPIPGLPGVDSSSVAWGDYDNDGRLDFLLTGQTNYSTPSPIAQLWKNTGSGFTNVPIPGLPGVFIGSVAWGDYDNDGWLDFLLTGWNATLDPVAQVWRNTGSGFTNVTATVAPGLPGVRSSSVAWGDYDNDGWLDFLLTGDSNSVPIAQVWHNTGSGFTNVTATVAPGLPGVRGSSVAWGDYDNDGRLDFLLTGTDNAGFVAQVWKNTGNGFTNVLIPGLPGVYISSVAWGDYDNDGRLDFLLTGYTGSDRLAQVWRNIGSTANTLPTPPTGLAAAVSGSTVTLSWNPASDAETAAAGLTYNLRVGTTPGGFDVVSPYANPVTGFCRLPAMGQAGLGLSAEFSGLSPGFYYWSVQAVDSTFAGSPFAPEQQFVVAIPPQVTTLPASGLAGLGGNAIVNLNSAIIAGGLPTTVWFEWGTNASYGDTSLLGNLASGFNSVAVSQQLSGLAIGTTYHYRATASNNLGVAYGLDRTFTIWAVTNLANSGAGSLRETISNAVSGDILVLTNSGTITVTNAELSLDKDLSIVGPGAVLLSLSGNDRSRIFNVASNVTVSLFGLTIRDGHAPNGTNGVASSAPGSAGAHGGGIYNAGLLTLRECVITNNRAGIGGTGQQGNDNVQGVDGTPGGAGADGGSGGGIYNHVAGTIWVQQCIICSNRSGTAGNGGRGGHGAEGSDYGWNGGAGGIGGDAGLGSAIYNAGIMALESCQVYGNACGRGGNGGAGGNGGDSLGLRWGRSGGNGGSGGRGGEGGGIHNGGQGTLINCTLNGNLCGAGGVGGIGGVRGRGPLGDGSTGARGVSGDGGSGGAVWTGSDLDLSDCVITNNHAGIGGSGQWGNGYVEGADGTSGAAGAAGGSGGGVYNHVSGALSLQRCAISGNSSGKGGNGGPGGVGGYGGDFSSGTDGGAGGNGGDGGVGSGIHNAGILTLEASLVYRNVCGRGGDGGVGGDAQEHSGYSGGNGGNGGKGGQGGEGGGIHTAGQATLINCTLNGNLSGTGGAGGNGGILGGGHLALA